MSLRRLSLIAALVLAACGGSSDDSDVVADAPRIEPPVERPTPAELAFSSSSDMFAAFGDIVVGVDSARISDGPDGVSIIEAGARALDLRDGSVTEIDLPGDGYLSPLALGADAAGVVLVVEDCPEEPTSENTACDEPTIGASRLVDPSEGWVDLTLDLDSLPGAFTGVSSMTTSADGLTAIFRTQDDTRTYRHLARLDGDVWRVLVAVPDGTDDACRTTRATYALVKAEPDPDPSEVSDPSLAVSRVTLVELDDSGEVTNFPTPPVAEGFGAISVGLGCDADGPVLVSGEVGDPPPVVYEWTDEQTWHERPDLVGGDTSASHPGIRSAPEGVQLTWTDIASGGTPLPTTVTITARSGESVGTTEIPINTVVVPRPSNGDLVLLPGPEDESGVTFFDPAR